MKGQHIILTLVAILGTAILGNTALKAYEDGYKDIALLEFGLLLLLLGIIGLGLKWVGGKNHE